MDAKKFDITLSDGVLTLKGEKQQDKEVNSASCHMVEIDYGGFHRSIQIPPGSRAKAQASYKNGVLHIVLPKSEEAKTKEFKIKVESAPWQSEKTRTNPV